MVSEPNNRVSDIIINHAKTLYNVFMEGSEWDNEVKQRVFTGSVVSAYKRTGASTASYSKVIAVLSATGAVEWLQRGAGQMPSRVALIREPSAINLPEKMLPNPLTSAARLDRLRQQMDDVLRQTKGVDIAAALENHERRIAAIEQMFALLEIPETK